MFSLFNFSSIFLGGSADPICPYVRMPMHADEATADASDRAVTGPPETEGDSLSLTNFVSGVKLKVKVSGV